MYPLSIITVCYNSADHITHAIESILSQKFQNFEYIIIDGQSTDHTLDIIESYRPHFGERLTLISEQDNGLYEAMNKGIEISKGNIIGILNSDDIFNDDSVLSRVHKFHSNNQIDASIGNVHYKDEKKFVRYFTSKNWNPNRLKYGLMPPHASIFFDKDLFNKFGCYDPSYTIASDYDLIVRFFLKNNISFKYSNITTTIMSTGGISNRGQESYQIITEEICKILSNQKIKYYKIFIKLRFLWKIREIATF